MINQASRYVNDATTVVTSPERGTHQAVIKSLPGIRRANFTWYQVKEGETVDLLAFNLFGEGQKWWMIADLNPEILDWMALSPGMVIRTPYGR